MTEGNVCSPKEGIRSCISYLEAVLSALLLSYVSMKHYFYEVYSLKVVLF